VVSFGLPVATTGRGERVKIPRPVSGKADKADTVSALRDSEICLNFNTLRANSQSGRTGERSLYHSAWGLSDAKTPKAIALADL
jgi:hypothetical protein